MRKIKILYTIPNFDTAGSGKVLYDLAKGLNKNNFDVHIACSHNNGIFFDEVRKLELPIHFIETTCKLKPYYSVFSRVKPYRDFIKQNKFDIVHSWHWSSDWTEVLGVKLGGAKFVYTKKAMSWGNIHWKIRSFLSDFIITINEEMKKYFPYKKQQSLIPIGLDTNYYNPVFFLKPENKYRERFKIITVANLVPVKGVEVLIDAIVLLNNSNIELLILGEDNNEYGRQLKQRVKGLNSQIEFLGKHIDVRPFLVQSDLFVIPTLNSGRKEAFGVALTEAMSMQIPVLGSDVVGIKFVLKNFNELLFESGNADRLAEKIKMILGLSVNQRHKLGVKLRNEVKERFSISDFIKKHEEIYMSLVKG